MFEERQKDILKAVVFEFLKEGKPISSLTLYKKYNLGIKPAMIRKELDNLRKKGYLIQPYYSSGRIPSNLAYNFFIKEIIENNEVDGFKEFIDDALINLFKKMDFQEAAFYLAKRLNILSIIVNLIKPDFVYKWGWEYLIDEIRWCDVDELKQTIRNIEYLDKKINSSLNNILKQKNFIKIFVGKNPLIKNDFFSVIIADYFIKNQRILVAAVGSKRMDYQKNYCLFKGLKEYLKT